MIKDVFYPRSVAVIGASRKEKSVGYDVLKSLLKGGVFNSKYNKPFTGAVYPVNPKAKAILGKQCYSSVREIPGRVDLAIICVPASLVPLIVKECCDKKVGASVIISAGFGELGKEGKEVQERMTPMARKAGMRLVGPNCLGVINTDNNMSASFAPAMPPKGNVALVSQSGALIDSIVDWSIQNDYGFSKIVSVGNSADLDVSDYIEYLGGDKHTKSIALYLEGLTDGQRFMKVCKKVGKKKPIVVLKAGRTQKGIHAVSSHTGSLAGGYDVFKAACAQSGVTVANSVDGLFNCAYSLAHLTPAKNRNIGIITNGGGAGVLCADYCTERGLDVVDLDESTMKKLDATGKMHPAYSRANPLDIVGDALPERYNAAINVLMKEKYISGLIIIQTLQAMSDPLEDAKIVVKAHKKYPNKPIVCCFMGGVFSYEGIAYLREHGIPNFNDPINAARAMRALVDRKEYLER